MTDRQAADGPPKLKRRRLAVFVPDPALTQIPPLRPTHASTSIFPSVMKPATRVLKTAIIEDNTVLLDLLTGMLEGIQGVEVVGHGASEADALALMRATQPRLVIVDLELRGSSGLGVLAALQKAPDEYGAPVAVVYSNHAHPIVQARCLALGAKAFFDKSFQMEDLLDFIQNAARGA